MIDSHVEFSGSGKIQLTPLSGDRYSLIFGGLHCDRWTFFFFCLFSIVWNGFACFFAYGISSEGARIFREAAAEADNILFLVIATVITCIFLLVGLFLAIRTLYLLLGKVKIELSPDQCTIKKVLGPFIYKCSHQPSDIRLHHERQRRKHRVVDVVAIHANSSSISGNIGISLLSQPHKIMKIETNTLTLGEGLSLPEMKWLVDFVNSYLDGHHFQAYRYVSERELKNALRKIHNEETLVFSPPENRQYAIVAWIFLVGWCANFAVMIVGNIYDFYKSGDWSKIVFIVIGLVMVVIGVSGILFILSILRLKWKVTINQRELTYFLGNTKTVLPWNQITTVDFMDRPSDAKKKIIFSTSKKDLIVQRIGLKDYLCGGEYQLIYLIAQSLLEKGKKTFTNQN